MENLSIKKGELKNFAKIYTDMQDYFPPEELKTYEKFWDLLNTDKYIFFDILIGEEKIGYLTSFIEEKNNIAWIDYFVIKKEHQSKGYGTKVLEKIKDFFQDKNGIFIELEKEDKLKPNTIRRANFYKRNKAEKLEVNYIYPDYNKLIPMDLFYLPINEKHKTPEDSKAKEIIKNVFEQVHNDVEGIENIIKKYY